MESMKQLVIDRLDGKYAICTDSDQKFYAIELPEVPQGAKAGSVLRITDEGELQLDVEATQRRQQGQQHDVAGLGVGEHPASQQVGIGVQEASRRRQQGPQGKRGGKKR